MSISFPFLLLLIATAAISPALDGPVLHGIVGVIAAGALGIVAYTLPSRMSKFMYLRRPFMLIAFMAGLPATWMLLQILPLGGSGLANPIWESAESALGRAVSGTITIDLGATIVSLGRYLAIVVILLVAMYETVERRRAAWTMSALMAATTVLAIDVLLEQFAGLRVGRSLEDRQAAAAAAAGANLGTILAAVEAIRLMNRHGRRAAKPGAALQLAFGLIPSLLAFAVCAAAVLSLNMWQDALAVVCGLATVSVVQVGRRFNFAPWQCLGSAAVVVSLVIALAASRNALAGSSPLLALGSAPHAQVATVERMIRDSPLFGLGAGTYTAVLPIYQAVDEPDNSSVAPTAAAAIAVEFGRPALGIVVLLVAAMVAWLMRAALLRGRDSAYPTAAAASLVAFTLQSFSNASLFATSIQIFASVLVGLGLAQSESRSDPH